MYIYKCTAYSLCVYCTQQEFVNTGTTCDEWNKTLVYGQKTVPLCEYLVNRYTTNQGQLVFDPFMGSGTKQIALLYVHFFLLNSVFSHSYDIFVYAAGSAGVAAVRQRRAFAGMKTVNMCK